MKNREGTKKSLVGFATIKRGKRGKKP